MNATTWLAIGLGGLAGAIAALAGVERTSPRPELPPAAALPTETARAPAREPTAAAPSPSTSEGPALRQAPPADAEPELAAPSASAREEPAPPPAVSSKEELDRAVIGCKEKLVPSACRTAALAYEQGNVVPADANEAKIFRRIELTLLVSCPTPARRS
jgi:hypothetical protein